MINTFIYRELDQFDENLYWDTLPLGRKQKASSYLRSEDRKNSVLAYLLLNMAVRRVYGIDTPDIKCATGGKPYFPLKQSIHFNLSHCRKGVICAVSDYEIGVDIQDIVELSFKTLAYVFSTSELDKIQNSDNSVRMAIKLWTQKESILKCIGCGFGGEFRETPIISGAMTYTYEYPDCFVSVTGTGEIITSDVTYSDISKEYSWVLFD